MQARRLNCARRRLRHSEVLKLQKSIALIDRDGGMLQLSVAKALTGRYQIAP